MVRRLPAEVGRELRAWLDARDMTEVELSRELEHLPAGQKVSQSWISRICNGDFKRFSGKTAIVLRYANIRVYDERGRDARGERIINAAVADVWDGSVGGAKALARVLRSAAALAREGRSEKR